MFFVFSHCHSPALPGCRSDLSLVLSPAVLCHRSRGHQQRPSAIEAVRREMWRRPHSQLEHLEPAHYRLSCTWEHIATCCLCALQPVICCSTASCRRRSGARIRCSVNTRGQPKTDTVIGVSEIGDQTTITSAIYYDMTSTKLSAIDMISTPPSLVADHACPHPESWRSVFDGFVHGARERHGLRPDRR